MPNSTRPLTSANNVSSPPRPTPVPGWKCVPCCRTMISPAPTSWPPKRLTPSRWALESRPFRLDDAPFLCAISVVLLPRGGAGRRCGAGRRGACLPGAGLRGAGLRGAGLGGTGFRGADTGDLHLGVLLPVTQAPPVTGLVLVVDHADLGAARVAHDLGGDLVAAYLRRVADDLAVVYHEHGGQAHAGTDLTSELVHGQDIVDRCLLLPAAAAHDRVHRELSLPCAGPPRDPRHRPAANWPACVMHSPDAGRATAGLSDAPTTKNIRRQTSASRRLTLPGAVLPGLPVLARAMPVRTVGVSSGRGGSVSGVGGRDVGSVTGLGDDLGVGGVLGRGSRRGAAGLAAAPAARCRAWARAVAAGGPVTAGRVTARHVTVGRIAVGQ